MLVTAAHCLDTPNHPGYLYGIFPGADASIYPRLVDLEPHPLAVTDVHAYSGYDTRPPFVGDIGVDGDDTVRVGDAAHVTCLGDSGGPALVDDGTGTEVLLGVDSFADNGSCNTPAYFRRVAAYQPFLDSYTGDQPVDVDAGVTPAPDAGVVDDDDGGCSTGGAASLPLALALLLDVRRRRAT